MAKIKWTTKAEIEQEQKKASKEKFKGKVLSAKDREKLLEQIAKDLGYL